jgi:hypothetical protein
VIDSGGVWGGRAGEKDSVRVLGGVGAEDQVVLWEEASGPLGRTGEGAKTTIDNIRAFPQWSP